MLPPSLLILDPNLHFSRAAAKYLSKFREVENVYLAADADEAFLMICARKPDALLVDYSYFSSDAKVAALCENVKLHFPDILIVALTLFTPETDGDLLPAASLINGLISKQDFAEGVITLFDLPLPS